MSKQMVELLPCVCGAPPILSESMGPLNGAEWKQYYCSARYDRTKRCCAVRASASRDLKTAQRNWNKAVKKIRVKES